MTVDDFDLGGLIMSHVICHGTTSSYSFWNKDVSAYQSIRIGVNRYDLLQTNAQFKEISKRKRERFSSKLKNVTLNTNFVYAKEYLENVKFALIFGREGKGIFVSVNQILSVMNDFDRDISFDAVITEIQKADTVEYFFAQRTHRKFLAKKIWG